MCLQRIADLRVARSKEQRSGGAPRAAVAEGPSAPVSVKAHRPRRGAQNRAALTDASAPGEALI